MRNIYTVTNENGSIIKICRYYYCLTSELILRKKQIKVCDNYTGPVSQQGMLRQPTSSLTQVVEGQVENESTFSQLRITIKCDVFKENEWELANIDFEIEPIIVFYFHCILLYLASQKWLYLWNCKFNFDGGFNRIQLQNKVNNETELCGGFNLGQTHFT